MKNYEDFNARDARLIMLRELYSQPDGRLNETILSQVLDMFGHKRSREWVRSQLLKMQDIGAVSTKQVGSVFVAAITRAGIDHVERRSFLDGIDIPSPEA